MCGCKQDWRKPFTVINSQRRDEAATLYSYCQNCGEHNDQTGAVVVQRSMRCPNHTWHHVGALCLECGNDERSQEWKHLSLNDLRAARIANNLDSEPQYLLYCLKRVELLQRLRRGETIPAADYQQPFSQK